MLCINNFNALDKAHYLYFKQFKINWDNASTSTTESAPIQQVLKLTDKV